MASLFDENPVDPETFFPNVKGMSPDEAAAAIGRWIFKAFPRELVEKIPAAVLLEIDLDNPSGKAGEGLAAVLEWWNRLAAEKLVSHSVRVNPVSYEIRKAWRACCLNREIQETLQDLSIVEREIRRSELCREGWFRLEKLLGGSRNREGTMIARKLIEGGYRTNESAAEKLGSGVNEFLRRHGS